MNGTFSKIPGMLAQEYDDPTKVAFNYSNWQHRTHSENLRKRWNKRLEIHHGCFSFNQSCQVLTHGPSASVCPPVLQNMSALLDEAVRLDVDVSRPADWAAWWIKMIQHNVLAYDGYDIDSYCIHSNTGFCGMDFKCRSGGQMLMQLHTRAWAMHLWPQLHCIHSSLCHHLTVQWNFDHSVEHVVSILHHAGL